MINSLINYMQQEVCSLVRCSIDEELKEGTAVVKEYDDTCKTLEYNAEENEWEEI